MEIIGIDWDKIFIDLNKIYNLNQSEIARKVGVSRQMISSLKQQGGTTQSKTFEKLKEKFPEFSWETVFNGAYNELIEKKEGVMEDKKNDIRLGRALRDVRKTHGLRQSDLAKKIRMSAQMISHYENNRRSPSSAALLRYTKNFPNFDWGSLLKGEYIPSYDGNFKKEIDIESEKLKKISVGAVVESLINFDLDELELIQINIDYLKKKLKKET